jgi:hypothetical protein
MLGAGVKDLLWGGPMRALASSIPVLAASIPGAVILSHYGLFGSNRFPESFFIILGVLGVAGYGL